MKVQVNPELCAGCGACLEACREGAIQLRDWRAVIDEALCTGCEACIEACQNEAILSLPTQEPVLSLVKQPAIETRTDAIIPPGWQPANIQPERSLVNMAGAALAYLGREAAPRLVDVLIAALERRLSQTPTTPCASGSAPARVIIPQGKGKQRQIRCRGGRDSVRNHRRNHA